MNGADGYTPERGKDYWTEEDRKNIKDEAVQDIQPTLEEYQKQIEALEAENKKQQEELDILNSDYKEGKAEGETAVVSDGLPKSKISVKGNGNSYQETTEGYNLLNLEKYFYDEKNTQLNNGTITIENGKLKMNGTNATATMTAKSKVLVKTAEDTDVLPAGTYYFGVNTNGYYEDDLNTLVQFTIGEKTLAKNYILTQWYYPCSAGKTDERPLIISKDTTKKTYEPYTNGVATPNPNYKQDIEVITECSLVHRGKNIYKLNKEAGFNTTINGITYTFKEKGKVNIKGTASATSEIFLLGYSWETTNALIKLKENKKYTASCNIATEGVQIIPLKLASTAIGYLKSTLQSITFTGDNNGVSKILLRINSGVTVNEDIEFQIEEGSSATPYEPYIEPKIIPIDLAGNSIAGIKNTDIKDNLLIGINGSCEIKKNTVMDKYGENAIKAYIDYRINQGDYTLFQFVSKGGLDKTIPILSNRFRYAKNWNVDVESVYVGGGENKRIQCKILTSRLSENSLDGLINWIRANPLEFLYSVPNYETIRLPSIEPITLFEGTNIFELVTNLGTTLAVTYKVSNKKKILNLEERISALESAVIGG